jgi:hypothetical protein
LGHDRDDTAPLMPGALYVFQHLNGTPRVQQRGTMFATNFACFKLDIFATDLVPIAASCSKLGELQDFWLHAVRIDNTCTYSKILVNTRQGLLAPFTISRLNAAFLSFKCPTFNVDVFFRIVGDFRTPHGDWNDKRRYHAESVRVTALPQTR